MIKNLLGDDDDRSGDEVRSAEPNPSLSFLNAELEREEYVISTAEPASFAETARRSGLAWSAGIAFFASVVFMLILGWFADLLFGSSPWGVVGGIVIGSLIGFVQLFRLASQIFKK